MKNLDVYKIIIILLGIASLFILFKSQENNRYQFISVGQNIAIMDTRNGTIYITHPKNNSELKGSEIENQGETIIFSPKIVK